jgi:hypothetical protein
MSFMALSGGALSGGALYGTLGGELYVWGVSCTYTSCQDNIVLTGESA